MNYSKVMLQLEGTNEPIEIAAGFVDSPAVDALLGQEGFFNHFRVCFDKSKEEVEIRPTRRSTNGHASGDT